MGLQRKLVPVHRRHLQQHKEHRSERPVLLQLLQSPSADTSRNTGNINIIMQPSYCTAHCCDCVLFSFAAVFKGLAAQLLQL